MIVDRPSANFDARPEGAAVDILVVHYTGMETAEAALDRLMDPAAKVSAHYLIDEDGTLYRLVEEDRRAWHAGVASWRGATDVNARSIGIELVNPGHEFGYRPFPEAQTGALIDLAADIVARHRIPARNVVGHADVAPRRKMDPGELFDWPRLAAAGIGLWPEESDTCIMDPEAVQRDARRGRLRDREPPPDPQGVPAPLPPGPGHRPHRLRNRPPAQGPRRSLRRLSPAQQKIVLCQYVRAASRITESGAGALVTISRQENRLSR